MKKIVAIALALALLFTAALAEDLSSLTDEELTELLREVREEGENRSDRQSEEILDWLRYFFACWLANDTEGMLRLCSTEWKATAADPEAELKNILGHRKPVECSPGEVSGTYTDDVRTAFCTVYFSKDDENITNVDYRIDMVREDDGKWHVDPRGLRSSGKETDVTSLNDEDLADLEKRIRSEIENRNAGTDEACADRLVEFFAYWSASELESMLDYCSLAWKNANADPKQELFRILGNRVPKTFELKELGALSDDGTRTAAVSTVIDPQNGGETKKYLYRITVVRDSDGKWYVDPVSLYTIEPEEYETPQPELTPVPPAPDMEGTLLFYVPEGGEKYHVDPDCPAVNDRYKPMQGTFLYGQLNSDPYRDLEPCPVCGAPERP